MTRADTAAPVDADATTTADAETGAVACPAPSPGSLQPYENPANGSVSGPDVAATICNIGASAFANQNGTFLHLASNQGAPNFEFTNPASANGPQDMPGLSGDLPLTSAAPGTYRSSDPINCGEFGFFYTLPVPANLDCDGGAPPQCPAGCISICSGLGCPPCTANPPTYGYGASGQTGGVCAEAEPQPGILTGSWTIQITSVTQSTGDAGSATWTWYAVHGSLSAQLLGGGPDAGMDPATLWLSF